MYRWIKKLFFSNRLEKNDNEGLNVVNSIVKAKKLYKELIIKAHPDKHPDKKELSQLLTEKVNSSRYDYKELIILKDMIEEQLKKESDA